MRVSALNYNGEGPKSVPLSIQACVIPSGVPNPVLVSSTITSITISWGSVENDGGCPILSYALFRDDGANGAISTPVDVGTIANKPYLFEHTLSLAALKGKVV